ncbi:MAG: UDP-N-acetylmuramate--L-alanine ligase [Candidatus Zixiibacteriota bacterium]|nr:MAG: UDP-N-acetylmuramate--L-alanine ligase [candidate division Zixibacteria bacterium]
MFGKIKKLYFVGIGGAGMSGIAEILHNLGYKISGSDNTPSEVTEYLQRLGLPIYDEHRASNIEDVDVVVISSAVGEDNPEVAEARLRGIPVIKRAEMLGELMRLKYSIGVSGTHGKTTTTSMIGKILQDGGYHPTLIVGGVVAELGTGAALGSGQYLVAEADEYDKSFLSMFPTVAVVTNLEPDHLDCYDGMEDLIESFVTYMNRVPFYGMVILSSDDANLASIKSRVTRPHTTFGFGLEADYRALNVEMEPGRTVFTVYHKGDVLGDVVLRVPGEFNVTNALAAVATCRELEVPFERIAQSLLAFSGVSRRFEMIGEAGGVLLVDDYAHHPSEIRATIDAARSVHKGRVIVIYQPHLYSRTRDFKKEFGQALSAADLCILTDIYPAREKPIEGITSAVIAQEAARLGTGSFEYVGVKENAIEKAAAAARPGDMVITMGAGSITLIKKKILEALKRGEK